jgi:hypothetical protein
MNRKVFLLFVLGIFSSFRIFAQYWEVGPAAGVSYYLGELNPGRHFNTIELPPSLGLIIRKSLNKRYALKSSFTYNNMSAQDRLQNISFNQYRKVMMKNTTWDASLHLEFNFFPYQIGTQERFTIYTFLGLTAYYYKTSVDWQGSKDTFLYVPAIYDNNAFGIAFPFGFGLKMNIGGNWGLAFEWGMRKLYTDFFDGVDEKFNNANIFISNRQNNDWYNISLISITYKFNKKGDRCPSSF